MREFSTNRGCPYPLGASLKGDGVNFALVSTIARAVTLCLAERESNEIIAEIPLEPNVNQTGNVWHILVHGVDDTLTYAYKIEQGQYSSFLLDPYAKSVASSNKWGRGNSSPPYSPFGEIILNPSFDWENDAPPHLNLNDLILYEMHVRGFTQHVSSEVNNPGTFLGIIEKIPHLLDLGVNAIELLPIQEFDEEEYHRAHPHTQRLYNYWGYSTVNFFAPMNRFASSSACGAAIKEFKTMVKSLHQHGIEVILDIVFNHTAEGNEKGPELSFKGIDPDVYYIKDNKKKHLNYSGCGNTVNANHPIVLEFIINVLRYWVVEMHVDGFRFDLASALTRGCHGNPLPNAPLIEVISKDPFLAKTKLIAEPWDAAGLYQVGDFSPQTKRWSEWNDKYRDGVRRFIKGTSWTNGDFAMRMCGSDDLYHARGPCASINFITAHDGFTLADLVSYNMKHNLKNGEHNRDGSNDNNSWNCGVEGSTVNNAVLNLRKRQMRNFHLALLLSQGIPMLLMGDEYGHTKNGNNNTWCQDNEINWFLWDHLSVNAAFYRFYRLAIHFRKNHSLLRRTTFLSPQDITWHGKTPFKPEWNFPNTFVAFTLNDFAGNNDLYVAFNANDQEAVVQLPIPPNSKTWHWIVNTANPSPTDFYENDEGPRQEEEVYKLVPHSAIILQAVG